MTWRDVQLGNELCDQDQILLNIIGQRSVQIHGNHAGFDQHCNLDMTSNLALLFFNEPMWISQIRSQCINVFMQPHLIYCYVAINRYQVLGNDTGEEFLVTSSNVGCGQDILNVVKKYLTEYGFNVKQTACMDQDRGRYFNFVQPLTWLYAERETDQNNQS